MGLIFKNKIFAACYLVGLVVLISCKDKYLPQIPAQVTGYLVVEGFINAGGGLTNISMTRSSRLDTSAIIPETGAQVQVQSENGDVYPLLENSPGNYADSPLTVNPAVRYRLHIQTADGKEYLSDFSEVKITPPIDEVAWTGGANAVSIFVSTHDDKNETKYYQWQFEETWKYNAANFSAYEYKNHKIVPRPQAEDFYTCWLSDRSTSISIFSTANLSADIVSRYPLTDVPYFTTNKLIMRYSILVKQYALSKEWYEWKVKVKKNTEQLGSIFDAQPSETGGNLHCITDPGEPVIGFVGCTTETDRRIFIDRLELPPVRVFSGYEDCQVDTVSIKPSDLETYFGSGYELPIDKIYLMGILVGISASDVPCADCRAKGGTLMKPPFW